jgi:iron(III) transport system substrate-binding protein
MRKNFKHGRFAAVGVAALLGLALTGCGGSANTAESAPSTTESAYSAEWQAVVDAAEKEGEVNLVSMAVPATNEALAAAFMQKYPGINASLTRATTSAIGIQDMDAQRAQGALAYDGANLNQNQWIRDLQAKGLIAHFEGPAAQYWDDTHFKDGVADVEGKMMLIGYNTDLVETPPTDWSDLLNEKYVGRVGVFLNQGGPSATSFYKLLANYSDGYLEKLAAMQPKLYNNDASMAQALASGEIAIGNFVFLGSVGEVKEQGAPVGWAVAKSGTTSFSNQAFAFTDAPHPNAAKLMVDFMMSREGQQIINGNERGLSFPFSDLEGAATIDQSLLHPVTAEDEGQAVSDEWIARFRDTFGG